MRRKELFFGICILALLIASTMVFSDERHYALNVKEAGGKLVFVDVNVLAGPPKDMPVSDNGIMVSLLSLDSTVLFNKSIAIKANSTNTIETPYDSKASSIIIEDKANNKSLNISVIAFADLCGDRICQKKENAVDCPVDCKSGVRDGFCDGLRDGICDPDCNEKSDPDCKVGWTNKTTSTTVAQTTTSTTRPSVPSTQTPGFTTSTRQVKTTTGGSFPWMIVIIIVVIAIIMAIAAVAIISNKNKNEEKEQLYAFVVDAMNKGFSYYDIRNHLITAGYDEKSISEAFEYVRSQQMRMQQ